MRNGHTRSPKRNWIGCESLESRQLLATNPIIEQVGHLGGAVTAVATSGQFVYANQGSELLVVDTSSGQPQIAGRLVLPDIMHDIEVVGSLLFIAAHQLQIVDVSNAAHPVLRGTYVVGGASGVEVVGDYAYVAGGSGLRIVNISNPAAPVLTGQVTTASQASDVAVNGTTVVVATGNGMEVINAANRSSPARVATYTLTNYGNGEGVTLVGNLAYLSAGMEGLHIIDVTTPASPVLRGSRDTQGSSQHAVLAGNYAFISDTWGGVQVVDVSNPANPTLV
jgi:hypothetical protein